MKVIIATDGTTAAIGAARRAVELLRPDCELMLVTVVPERPDPLDDAGGFEGPLFTEEEADDQWRAASAAGRDALERTMRALGSQVAVDRAEVVASDTSVDDALVHLVEQERPALLVLGAHDHSWFDRVFRGATEDRLLHRAPCPLLIVSEEPDPRR